MLSPYLLPPGNVQICFSGGRTSGFLLHAILTENGGLPDRARVVFTNTGAEHPATLDFVQECASRWGVRIDWLEYRYSPSLGPHVEEVSHNSASRNNEPFEALIDRRKFLPNQAARFCTTELKVRTAKRYLCGTLGWAQWTSALGIRADEPSRLKKARRVDGRLVIPAAVTRDRFANWYPLAAAGVTKSDVMAFWRAQSFDLKLSGPRGVTPEGNCVGCFLKSEATLAAMWRDHPDRMQWWLDQERKIQAVWPSMSRFSRLRRVVTSDPDLPARLREAYGRPIPPGVVSGIVDRPRSAGQFSKRYGHAELSEFIDRQGDLAFSTEGILCQANGGECFD